MGFLDKLQQTAKETLDKGKEKVSDLQADRKADQLLRDLGAWYYAGRTGRDGGDAAANVERIVAELQAHEAEHGPLDEKARTEEAPAGGAPAAAPTAASGAPTDAEPPVAPAPPPTDVTEAPPAPPVTSGPPPPPED